MEVSSDPYEQKLFQMFQSCDTERSGVLDEKSLRRLCEMLELRDNGSVLIDDLAANGNAKSRVSFVVFKEALLNFLGTELDGSITTSTTTTQRATHTAISSAVGSRATTQGERILIINDEVETYIDSPPESSDREVSPKLVVGSKKYGRRSRPHMFESETTPSDSEENETVVSGSNGSNNAVQRSSSQTDIGSSHRRRPTTGSNKLKRCASLPAQKNQRAPRKTKAAAAAQQVTAMTDSLLLAQKEQNSSTESLDTFTHFDTLSAQAIISMWERVGILNSKGILLTLGFDEDVINLSQLSKVLDEELRSLEGEHQTTLLKASLALQSAELTALRQTLRQLRDENKKIHADNKDANRRVALLAQEIDERHANLEDTTRKEIRLLEQRHAEVVRDLTLRLTNDRENWTNLTSRLEAKIKVFEQEEIKWKTELELVSKENSALEEEQQLLQKQVTDLLETNIQLNHEITDIENRSCNENLAERNAGKSESEEDEVLKLVEKISTLQVENSKLRDKNDELVAEVEGLNMELTRAKAKANKKTLSASTSTTTTTLDSIELPLEDLEQGAASTTAATKRRGDSPSKTRINEESPRLGKLRKCANDMEASETSDTSGDWVALNSELQNSATRSLGDEQLKSADLEVEALKKRIADLEEEIKQLKETTANSSAEERCKELDSSLEQMQRAYEDCEDYWQSKLAEERQLFDKERQIYEDEQQESDKKFTELMEKVREYEEQFSKDGRLSPIEEKDTLEQQYADLEAEAEEIRENARLIFEEKTKEIESLQSEIEDLRIRLGESVEILTGANELNTEATQKCNEMSQSPANSPISYLWHQSTIQSPAKDYHQTQETNSSSLTSNTTTSKQRSCINLSTSETAIFSTTLMSETTTSPSFNYTQNISPIQKPVAPKGPPPPPAPHSEADTADCDSSSTISGKSFDSNSVASTHSVHHSQIANNNESNSNRKTTSNNMKNSNLSSRAPSTCSSPSPSTSGIKEELKRLKFFEISLKEQIKDLSLQRDGLVMELQQLHEARPVLEKAYARTAHPTLIQRVNQLELKNRHLQNVIKQQQQYTESLMQQTWQQHHSELNDLRNRIEAQGMMMAEQSQRLQNADILVKELYVENSHLTATVQRMEQQRTRANLLHQHQGLSGLSGMP